MAYFTILLEQTITIRDTAFLLYCLDKKTHCRDTALLLYSLVKLSHEEILNFYFTTLLRTITCIETTFLLHYLIVKQTVTFRDTAFLLYYLVMKTITFRDTAFSSLMTKIFSDVLD